jgi:hypothetical protein
MNHGFVTERVHGRMSSEELAQRVHSLRALPKETEWVEFKQNNADPRFVPATSMHVSAMYLEDR